MKNKQGYNQAVWANIYMSLKYIRKDKKKNVFVPKIIVRKAEKQFKNEPKVG